MNTQQKFGKRIKIERIMRDWTIEKLAEEAGLGTSTIGQVENGSSSPTLDTIEKLAKALDFKIHELLIFDDLDKFARKK
ncbi:MAG: helix-turn-helix transcriptional regulator [Candidatus Gastranaerophilales bacterium]|nr:helix-turn-helix transcriptional regulator [Candidatus Gastranaerophilales bacterium]